jgi:hypothetical protein
VNRFVHGSGTAWDLPLRHLAFSLRIRSEERAVNEASETRDGHWAGIWVGEPGRP